MAEHSGPMFILEPIYNEIRSSCLNVNLHTIFFIKKVCLWKDRQLYLTAPFFFLHLFFLFNCTFNNHVTLVPNNRCKGPQIPPAEGSTDSGISKVHPLIPSLFLKIDLFSLFAKVTKVTNKVGL